MSKPYRIYGHFYDATQGPSDGQYYLHLLQKYHPKAKTLLEIACGTGAHLLPLSEHYSTSGLDISGTMLKYARKKLPTARFYKQDMTCFKLKAKFDAIVCPYDSINHVLRFAGWKSVFESVEFHLNRNGVFIFDINTEFKLRELAESRPLIREFNGNILSMAVKDVGKGIYDWEVRIFESKKQNTFKLHREIIKEVSFPCERIKRALEKHFGRIRILDIQQWSRPKKKSRRLFFVCHKMSERVHR